MAEHKKGAIAYYLIIALVLGAITYVEFAIVEYKDAITFLNSFWTLAWLAILSIIKFALVVAIYMHLRDDDPIYTSFFSSGIVIAMGTFIALSFLFTVKSINDFRQTTAAAVIHQEADASHGEADAGHGEAKDEAHGGDGHGAVHVETDPVKTLAEQARVPSPKNQASLADLVLPAAPAPEYSLRLPGLALAASAPVAEAAMETEVVEAEVVETEEAVEVEASVVEATETADADAVTEEAEEVVEASAEVAEEAAPIVAQAVFDWEELGATTYQSNCLACHQAEGQGIPSAFPPLAGHMPTLYNAEGGREYLINVVLYGLMGAIEVDGVAYNGVMTPWAAILSDEQVAATLNHELMSWGNADSITDFSPILPEEVAALRDAGLSGMDVLGLRPELP